MECFVYTAQEKRKVMRYLFVCGGSAGHINPAIAIATEMRRSIPESKILFVGADKTLEKKLVPAAGFDLVNIKMSGLRRGVSPRDIVHNTKTVCNLISARKKSTNIIKEFDPDVVVATGGYISYPVVKKAVRLRIPAFILEPNAYPGLAVRMLSNIVENVFVAYKDLESRYKKPERVIYTGTPLRSEFFEKDETSYNSNQNDKPLVLSYWGSLGASKMNEMILELSKLNLSEGKFRHIHAAGVGSGVEEMKKKLKTFGISDTSKTSIEINEYIDDMPSVMKSADLVLSRAGASTIAELTAFGKPAILVPSPNVTENHQEENAKQLQKAGGAIMILEKECTADALFKTISTLLDDKEKLKKMSEAQKALTIPNAASKIVEIIINHCSR